MTELINGRTLAAVTTRSEALLARAKRSIAGGDKWRELFAAYLRGDPIPPRAATEIHGRDLAAAVLLLLGRRETGAFNASDFLLDRHDYAGLPPDQQRMLEDARKLVLDIATTLCRAWPPPILPEARAFETERAADARKAMIHAVEDRIRRGELDPAPLRERRAVWALDRIARCVAWSAGLLPGMGLDDMIDALRAEEEDARTRALVTGLQPLYYAAEAIDETLDAAPSKRTAARLADALTEVELLLDAHPGRDTGRHIRRRIESIRAKLAGQP